MAYISSHAEHSSTDNENKTDKIETEIVDYKRIFSDNPKETKETNKIKYKTNVDDIKDVKKDNRIKKEKNFIFTFLIQSLICLIIIGSIIVTKYASPNTFVSVSSTLNGLYQNNITLSDLNRIIDEEILNNDALAAFFNMSGK